MAKAGVKNEFAQNSEPEDSAELTRRAREIVSSPDVRELIRSKGGVTALMMAICEAYARAVSAPSMPVILVKSSDQRADSPANNNVGDGQLPPKYTERTGEDLKLSAIEFTRLYYGAAIDRGDIPNMETLRKIDLDLARAVHKFRANHKVSRGDMVAIHKMPPSRRSEGDVIEAKAQEGQPLTPEEAYRLGNRLRYRERTGQPSPP